MTLLTRGGSSPEYVAAFRTYAWNPAIAELARRFFAATPHARQVVLIDESRGPIEVPGYEKISHTADNVFPGLPNYPRGQSLWFNVDYGIYALQRELPGYSHYLFSESDLAVNLSLEPMMQFAIDQQIDLIAHQVHPSSADWFWHPHALQLSKQPWRSLLFFMVLSYRAIESLLAARKALAERFSLGEIKLWPFCEAFLPTVLKAIPNVRFAEVSDFAITDNLRFRPRISLNDPRANQPGSLVHSVLGGKRFIETVLAKHPAQDFFREESELRVSLLLEAASTDIAVPLYQAFATQHDYGGMGLLWNEPVIRDALAKATVDVAFCKPALSSSVSSYSRHKDRELDACGANGDQVAHDFGFHTAREDAPSWMVDLLSEHQIEEVTIVNRLNEPERFRTFRIETSCDGDRWTTRFEQTVPSDVSSDVESPWRQRFDGPFPARFLRVVLIGSGVLHLRRIQVFGRPRPPEKVFVSAGLQCETTDGLERRWPAGPRCDLALCKPALASSVSQWSRYQDPVRDASGANGEEIPHGYGFHTQQEANPWWRVDLLGEHLIEEVAIVNRPSQSARFKSFRIQSSLDCQTWKDEFIQLPAEDVSSDTRFPWRVRFKGAFVTRFVRIVLLGDGPLHLRRVQVFGRVLPADRIVL